MDAVPQRITRARSFRWLFVAAFFAALFFVYAVPAFAQDAPSGGSGGFYSRETLLSLPGMTAITFGVSALIKRLTGLGSTAISLIALGLALVFAIVHAFVISNESSVIVQILLVIANTYLIFTATYGTNEFLAPPATRPNTSNPVTSWRNPSSGSTA
ncbi:MAG: hypothetical protein SF162_10260 [bacterium]|nr:hypothetical protein [bacterium]